MSDEPEKTSYYLRLLSMYMDLGTDIVLGVFIYHSPGQDADTFLKSKQDKIIHLRNNRILNGQECTLLFDEDENILKCNFDFKNFDISLLITLSRHLFTDRQLAPPLKGWINPPRNSDKSVAADLIRLKKIRNVIVGHHPRARLSLGRFEEEWKNVSEILLRLQHQIAPEKEIQLHTRIKEYQLQRLDPTVKNKYDTKLEEWHNEVTSMQYKVEELIKKLGGFEAYFNSKSDRLERYTKLLFKGGRFVLAAFLDKKIKDEGKDLRKWLMDNEDAIRKVVSDKEQLDKLYPCIPTSQTKPTHTSSWKVPLLSTVILQMYNSTEDKGVILNIKKIGEAYRNYANATLLALDNNAFEDYWTDLKTSINIVSYKLDDSNAECCYQILEECKKKIDENEFKTYMEELKAQGTQIATFTETFKEILQRTKDVVQEMTENGISFKNAQVVELKMITLGNDEQQKKLAEEILIEVWNEALGRAVQSTAFLDVKREVLNILEEIKKSKSVENISVKTKCVLLQIKCTSPRAVLEMIEFFQSNKFYETMKNISIELGYFFDAALDVYSVITVECLWRIYNQTNATNHDEEGGLSLQMSVSSPAGIKHLKSLCSKDTIANCTNSIADALSKHIGGTIALKAVADMKEFKHVFETDSSSSDSCSECSSMEGNVQDNNYSKQIDTLAEGKGFIYERQLVEETEDVEEFNKHVEGINYALNNLKLTSDETGYQSDSDMQTMSLEVEIKEKEDNSKRFHEASEKTADKIIKYENKEEAAEPLKEVDRDLKDIDKRTTLEYKEKLLKDQQDMQHVDNQDTSQVRRISERYSSHQATITLSGDGIVMETEELFKSNLLYELLLSQKGAARFLELAYLALREDPEIARQVRKSADDAQNQHLRTHGLVREYQGTALHVVKTMLPLIEVGVRKKKVNLVQKGLQKVLTYVDDMIQRTKATTNEYYKIKGEINDEISNINDKNKSIKERESEISAEMKKNKLLIEKEMQEIKSKTILIEEELKELKVNKQKYLKQSAQSHGKNGIASIFSDILTTGMATIGTIIRGPEAGRVIYEGATAAKTASAKQASQHAIVASEKTKEDIQKGQDMVDENEKRIAKMREDAIQSLVAMEKLALENANQMNEESLKIAGEELGKVAQLFAKILLFWEDFSAKLTALSKSHDAVEQFIEFITDPDLAEDIDESVGQVKKVWNAFGIMCTCYVDESEKQLGELYAFMSRPVDHMAVEECNKRKRELLETHRMAIEELESKLM